MAIRDRLEQWGRLYNLDEEWIYDIALDTMMWWMTRPSWPNRWHNNHTWGINAIDAALMRPRSSRSRKNGGLNVGISLTREYSTKSQHSGERSAPIKPFIYSIPKPSETVPITSTGLLFFKWKHDHRIRFAIGMTPTVNLMKAPSPRDIRALLVESA